MPACAAPAVVRCTRDDLVPRGLSGPWPPRPRHDRRRITGPMIRKTLGVAAAAGLLAVAVAGPVAAQAPEDPLGVVTAQPGEPVVIAGWGVSSGADASLGTDW